jgi:hypothetical protein
MPHLKKFLCLSAPLLYCLLAAGCATFPGAMDGAYAGPDRSAPASRDVSVLFLLRHVKQARGLDAIPKLIPERQIVRDFDNLLVDAVTEISNLGSYTSFTEFPSDVSQPERVARKEELIRTHDYVVEMRILEEYSFIRQFFGGVFSAVSVTLLPVPYTTRYSIEVEVVQAGNPVASYRRARSKTMWVQALLLLIQPFHNDTLAKERIYIDLLHDVLREVEASGVLG